MSMKIKPFRTCWNIAVRYTLYARKYKGQIAKYKVQGAVNEVFGASYLAIRTSYLKWRGAWDADLQKLNPKAGLEAGS